MSEISTNTAERGLIPHPRLYKFLEGALKPILLAGGGYSAYNIEAMDPLQGKGLILASSHESMMDPVVLGHALATQIDRPMHSLAKRELWTQKYFGAIIGPTIQSLGAIPVDRKGAGLTEESSERVDKVLRQGAVLMTFPTGTRVPISKDTAKRGTARFSIDYQIPIVPAGIASIKSPTRLPRIVVFGDPIYPKEEAKDYSYFRKKDEALRMTEELVENILELESSAREYLESNLAVRAIRRAQSSKQGVLDLVGRI